MKVYIKITILLTIFMQASICSYADEVDGEKEKASLIVYISNLVEWPVNDSVQVFTIGILGDKPALSGELQKIAEGHTLNNKPIVIKDVGEYDNPDDVQVIFIDKAYHKDIEEILGFCQKYGILQVTDRLKNKNFTVVNFIEDKENGNTTFEVNKDNLIASNIDYKDELLLYGGSIVDIQDLYRSTKTLLESEVVKVLLLNKDINDKDNELIEKNSSIDSLSHEIYQRKDSLAGLFTTIRDQTKRIEKQNYDYKDTENKLLNLKDSQIEQNASIKEKEYKLLQLDSAIKNSESTILSQANALSLKDSTIAIKNRLVLILILIGSAISFFGLIIYRAYFMKKRNNRTLEITLNELRQAQDKLIESEKMATIGVLAAGVAHEINNPLNYIKGGVFGIKRILEDNYQNNPEIAELIMGVDTGVDKAATIVSSLNHFSRQSEVLDEECNIHTVIDNCLVLLENTLKYRIKVEKDFNNTPIIIHGNEGKIHQVILNILTNSAQAIENKGNIWIATSLSQEDNKVCIEFRDSGCGIKPENIDKVTVPFFTTKEIGEGTGLGLSISKKIILDHKGELLIKSDLNKGTSIMIHFPLLINKHG